MTEALNSPAIAAILQERLKQIEINGHDADADAMLTIYELPRKAHDYTLIAMECLRGINGERDIVRAKKNWSSRAHSSSPRSIGLRDKPNNDGNPPHVTGTSAHQENENDRNNN